MRRSPLGVRNLACRRCREQGRRVHAELVQYVGVLVAIDLFWQVGLRLVGLVVGAALRSMSMICCLSICIAGCPLDVGVPCWCRFGPSGGTPVRRLGVAGARGARPVG